MNGVRLFNTPMRNRRSLLNASILNSAADISPLTLNAQRQVLIMFHSIAVNRKVFTIICYWITFITLRTCVTVSTGKQPYLLYEKIIRIDDFIRPAYLQLLQQ